jgi:hypothetical protein
VVIPFPEEVAMAGRRREVTDVRELIRRLRLGETDRRIARDLSMSRNTVARYRAAATQHGWLEGSLPDPAALAQALQPAPTARPPQEQSLVEPFREPVQRWLEQGVEGQAIWQLLVEQHGFTGSYSSLKRFLHRLAPSEPVAMRR